jgi:hypothetical protein
VGRSQRHQLTEQNSTSAGRAIAMGEIAPITLAQATSGPPPPVLRAPVSARVFDVNSIFVPMGQPGGPLSGSSLTGAIPASFVYVPLLDHVDPSDAEIGSPDVTLHVYGAQYTPECVILFNNGEEPTTFIDANHLTTIVKPSTVTFPGTVPVAVQNAAGGVSATVSFTFWEAVQPGYPKGPFPIIRIKPISDPPGARYVFSSNDGEQILINELVVVEGTGSPVADGNFTVTDTDNAGGQYHIFIADVIIPAQIDGQGQMTVIGGPK